MLTPTTAVSPWLLQLLVLVIFQIMKYHSLQNGISLTGLLQKSGAQRLLAIFSFFSLRFSFKVFSDFFLTAFLASRPLAISYSSNFRQLDINRLLGILYFEHNAYRGDHKTV
tara:strand:- start:567 stop:902 length:336 start_codon:yes stop_codon:yes gene_type:complete